MMNYKDIDIGYFLKTVAEERNISIAHIEKYLKVDASEITRIFESKTIDSGLLLSLSKLFEYDFFRIYSQHLILYSPPSAVVPNNSVKSAAPQFRKNIYTREIIDFILQRIENEEMTPKEIIDYYKIPKTTLYKWISKFKR